LWVLFPRLTRYNKRMTDSMTGAARVAQTRAMLDMLDPSDSSEQCIDRLQTLARLKARIAALEAEEIADLEQHRHEEEAARGVPMSQLGHGLAAEILIACGLSTVRCELCLLLDHELSQELHQLIIV